MDRDEILLDEEEYDLIVLGTGLTNSIIAGAAARVGLKVLHLDKNRAYGGDWASCTRKELDQKLNEDEEKVSSPPFNPADAKGCIFCGENISLHKVPAHPDLSVYSEFSQEDILPALKLHLESEVKIQIDEEEAKALDLSLSGGAANVEPQNLPEGYNIANEPESKYPKEEEGVISVTDSKQPLEPTKEDNIISSSDQIADVLPRDSEQEDSKPANSHEDVKQGSPTPSVEAPQTRTPEEIHKSVMEPYDRFSRLLKSRSLNLDMTPNFIFSRQDLVKIMIDCGVSQYIEFRSLNRQFIASQNDGSLIKIPCSKATVFRSKDVTMLEKRLLMKFIHGLLKDKDAERASNKNVSLSQPSEGESLQEYLASQKLTPRLIGFLAYGLALCDQRPDMIPAVEGMKNIKKVLGSLGRFSEGAFLYPQFGTGELPQGFCRACAVAGGCYITSFGPTHIFTDSNEDGRIVGVLSQSKQLLRTKWLLANLDYVPRIWNYSVEVDHGETLHRAFVLASTGHIQNLQYESETETTGLIHLPPQSASLNNPHTVRVLQLDYWSKTCPAGLQLLHLWTRKSAKSAGVLNRTRHYLLSHSPSDLVSDLDPNKRPAVALWWCEYLQRVRTIPSGPELPPNFILTQDPLPRPGYQHAYQEAVEIFERICPGRVLLEKRSDKKYSGDDAFEDLFKTSGK